MVISKRVRAYAIVAGIFVLGAVSGGAAAYAVTERRLADVLGEEPSDVQDSRRFYALTRQLDLTELQRGKVEEILQRSKGERRRLMREMYENCGQGLREHRSRLDEQIQSVLDPEQRERFRELSDKRARRFNFGGRSHGPEPR